jgi:hypothetical protein
MHRAMATLLMLGALAGCDEKLPTVGVEGGASAVPQVPSIIITHDDPPVGSALNHRIVRASRDVAVRLEPRWGAMEPRIHTIAPENRSRVAEELRKAMPQGWRMEPLDGVAPKGSELYGFSSGEAFFGALVVDPGDAPVTPVVILRNRALLDRTKE